MNQTDLRTGHIMEDARTVHTKATVRGTEKRETCELKSFACSWLMTYDCIERQKEQ